MNTFAIMTDEDFAIFEDLPRRLRSYACHVAEVHDAEHMLRRTLAARSLSPLEQAMIDEEFGPYPGEGR